jgi:hypothetical protein
MNSPDAIEESAAYEERRTAFFDLADRFLKYGDPAETEYRLFRGSVSPFEVSQGMAPRHKDTQPSLL